MPSLKSLLTRALLAVVLLGGIAAVSLPFQGCSPHGNPTAAAHSFTGKTLTRVQVAQLCGAAGVDLPIMNSATYAEVNSAWLPGFESRYQAHPFKDGIVVNLPTGKTGWDQTFDCVYYAEGFSYLAATEYHADSRLTFEAAPGLALFKVFYHPEDAMENHVIFVALTERGALFWDPQVGESKLVPIEVKSIYRAED